MLLARIVGTVVATRKDPRLISHKLLRRLHRQQDLVDNAYRHSSRIDQDKGINSLISGGTTTLTPTTLAP